MKNYLDVARGLTWRYVIALSLVASLSTAAWISLHLVIEEQKDTAAIVNVSGRQRMLSQRTALFANLLEDTPIAERPLIRGKLKEAVDLMERSHHGLTHGDEVMGLPGTMSPAVHALYFDGDNPLDSQVETYIRAVQDLLRLNDAELTPDNPLLLHITQVAPVTLVAALDHMVGQYQLEGEASIGHLQEAETIFWVVTLLLLMLEAALIFRPFARYIKSITGKLQGVSKELQEHQDYLEELVKRRTFDLESKSKALAESEQRYRALIENSPFCIHEIDLDGRLQSMNRAGLDMLGLDEEKKICGVPYLSAVGERDGARIRALLQDAVNGVPSHFEFASGGDKPVYFKSCFIPLRNADGKVVALMGLTEDISERKRMELQLLEREELFSAIFDQAPNGIELIDPDTLHFVEANPAACRMLGYTHEEFLGLRLVDTRVDMDEAALLEVVRQVEVSGGATLENRHRCKNGDILNVEISSRILKLSGRRLLVGVWRDITERKRNEERLRITASVFDTSQEAVLITDANNLISEVNPAFERITGYGREEVLGRNPKMLSSGHHDKVFYAEMWRTLKQKKAWRGEIWNRRKSGDVYAELLSITAICDDKGNVQRHVGVFSDISYLKEHEAALSRIAHYDALTGIPNRMLLADRMKQAIAQTSREQNMMAVCYLDLDGFKPINDTLGHEAGDEVLVEIAKRLGGTIRGGDTAARLGGDEFVVLLLGLERGDECVATLERLLAAIARPVQVKGKEIALGASIGVSIYPLDDEEPDTLLRHADQAMYLAKQAGKNRFHIYDPALDQRARDQSEFLARIKQGLMRGEFELFYQPKINLATRQLVGAEALIRWRHPERGLLAPAEFLRMVENTELDIEIGEWVIAAALAQIDGWHKAGMGIEVSINISAYHLESPRFVERLRQQLSRYPDLSPGSLQIEILETVALTEIVSVRKIIEACGTLGVSFALDDFGTGYSSLSYLSSLPVDVLKIDQVFVRDMLEDKGDMAIVQSIIALARAFGRKVVAEGIENDRHYQVLLDMECEVGQGYGIARPMPAGELINWKAG